MCMDEEDRRSGTQRRGRSEPRAATSLTIVRRPGVGSGTGYGDEGCVPGSRRIFRISEKG